MIHSFRNSGTDFAPPSFFWKDSEAKPRLRASMDDDETDALKGEDSGVEI